MNLEEKKEQIEILIKDLFYLSESDYPWQITSITPSEHVITEQEVDVDLFFNNLSHPSDMVDEFMRIQAKKYDLLFQFIKSNFNEIKIVKQGRIKRPLIVELTDENSKSIFLITHSLET